MQTDQTAANNGVAILIVEDSRLQAMNLQYILEQNGYQTSIARNGAEALNTLGRQRPTMVISDIEMPEMDGYELCQAIKTDADLKDLPVILLTSLSDPKDVVKGLECGADNFVVKPYDEQFLLSRIHYILANQELRAERALDGGVTTDIEVFFAGQKHILSSAPTAQRTVDLLLGTYETAIQKNLELRAAKEQLEFQAEELRKKNAQMEVDLNLAREIQQAFLPQQYVSFPPVGPMGNALHFHHRYIPTTELGGDFSDIIVLSDTQAGIFICDVMGHGVRSALVTAILRGLVEEMMPVAGDPGQFLTGINRSLLQILSRTRTLMFASAFYLIADVATGEMRYADAGHPSPLHVRPRAGTVEPLRSVTAESGSALGVFEESTYTTQHRSLSAGDLLVLFTDGLIEVENANGEEYDEELLLTAVRRRISLPPDQLFEELLTELRQFSASGAFEDDVCLAGMEVARVGTTTA